MNYAMEIHDSRLTDFAVNPDGTGFLLFHAVIYRSNGKLFEDAQESGWQQIRLSFAGMTVEGDLVRESRSLDGDLVVNGVQGGGIVHLPANHLGEIQFEFDQANDFNTRVVRATAMRSELEGEFELETYWDTDGSTRPARS